MKQTAFEKVRELIDKLAENMTRADYIEFVDELGAEIEGRRDCINEEEDQNE